MGLLLRNLVGFQDFPGESIPARAAAYTRIAAMPSARNPASAPRDGAERHVFGVLPELPAVERRVLALVELCASPLAAAASDLGLDEEAAAAALASARKALRRSR